MKLGTLFRNKGINIVVAIISSDIQTFFFNSKESCEIGNILHIRLRAVSSWIRTGLGFP